MRTTRTGSSSERHTAVGSTSASVRTAAARTSELVSSSACSTSGSVAGEITEGKLKQLRFGLRLDGRQLKRAQVTRIGDQRLRFVLTEGRNRQIRRMCELVGLDVVDLFRVRIGPLKLGDLPEGRWRALTIEERSAILKAAHPGEGRDPSRA